MEVFADYRLRERNSIGRAIPEGLIKKRATYRSFDGDLKLRARSINFAAVDH